MFYQTNDMTTIINNEKVNHLALTALIEAKQISAFAGSYTDCVKGGWQFFFTKSNGVITAVAMVPVMNGIERLEAVVSGYISKTIFEVAGAKA